MKRTFIRRFPAFTLGLFITYFLLAIFYLGWVCMMVALIGTWKGHLPSHWFALTAALATLIQSCVQFHFHRTRKLDPIEMMAAHTLIIAVASVALATGKLWATLGLDGRELRGQEVFMAMAAQTATCISISILYIVWTVVVWNREKYTADVDPTLGATSQQYPQVNPIQQWQRAEMPNTPGPYVQHTQPIHRDNIGNAVAGQTYTYDGQGRFVPTQFGGELSGDPGNAMSPSYRYHEVGGAGLVEMEAQRRVAELPIKKM